MSFMLSYCSALDTSTYQVRTRVPSRMNASQKNGKQLLLIPAQSALERLSVLYHSHYCIIIHRSLNLSLSILNLPSYPTSLNHFIDIFPYRSTYGLLSVKQMNFVFGVTLRFMPSAGHLLSISSLNFDFGFPSLIRTFSKNT